MRKKVPPGSSTHNHQVHYPKSITTATAPTTIATKPMTQNQSPPPQPWPTSISNINLCEHKPRSEHLNFTKHCQQKLKKHQQGTHKPTKLSKPKNTNAPCRCWSLNLFFIFWRVLSQEKKRANREKRDTNIFLVFTFWPYFQFSFYNLILPYLVPKIERQYRFGPYIF